MTQYVQHFSGEGEKWEVVEVSHRSSNWMVKALMTGSHHFLPKSEYRLCEPPERWVDVSHECEVVEGELYHNGKRVYWINGYRPRKVQLWERTTPPGEMKFSGVTQWAFIIEKREL